MQINGNTGGFQPLQNHTQKADGASWDSGRVSQDASKPTRGAASPEVAQRTLDRVAAENAAAAASRITDASLASELASLTAAKIAEGGAASLQVHGALDPQSIMGLLQA